MHFENKSAAHNQSMTGDILLGGTLGSLLAMNVLPMPYSSVFVLPPLAMVFWSVIEFFRRPDVRRGVIDALRAPSALTLTLGLVVLTMLYAVVRSSLPFRTLTYFEISTGISCVGLSLWVDANSRIGNVDRARAIYTIAIAVVTIAAAFGIVAIAKYISLSHGIAWPMIELQDGEFYPWGTSLRLDSNLFTVPFIVSLIFLFALVFSQFGRSHVVVVIVGLLSAIDLYVGINAASRRFLIFALIGAGLVVLLSLFFRSMPRLVYARRILLFVSTIILGYASIAFVVETSSVKNSVARAETVVVEGSEVQTIVSGNSRLTTIVDGSLFDTRLAYWKEATRLLGAGDWALGAGYDYQSELGCAVGSCGTYDYPHSFILSHFLAAGVLGLIASIAAFTAIVARAAASMASSRSLDRATGIVIVVIAGYALFSGDTIFALPAFCALPVLALLMRRPTNLSRQTQAI